MKKMLYLILLIFLFSCEKEKDCWECTQSWVGYEEVFIMCNKTEEEIRQIEIQYSDPLITESPQRRKITTCKLKI